VDRLREREEGAELLKTLAALEVLVHQLVVVLLHRDEVDAVCVEEAEHSADVRAAREEVGRALRNMPGARRLLRCELDLEQGGVEP